MAAAFANKKLNEPQENHGATVTMDANLMQRSHKKTAASDVLSGLRCALEAALKHVQKYLNEKNQHRTIILLSSISQNIWFRCALQASCKYDSKRFFLFAVLQAFLLICKHGIQNLNMMWTQFFGFAV
jgi:hypothetical protein